MCWDAERPECCSKTTRKARKTHCCDECRRTIQLGESYEYISGVWEGEPGQYKTCEACVILREHVREEDGCDEDPPLGMLLEAAREMALNVNPRLYAFESATPSEERER